MTDPARQRMTATEILARAREMRSRPLLSDDEVRAILLDGSEPHALPARYVEALLDALRKRLTESPR